MTNGVNYFGSLETLDGIGRASALNIKCLTSANIESNQYILSRPVALESGNNTVINNELLKSLPYRINIFHFSARWVSHYLSQVGEKELEKKYNIGYWVCEVPKIPPEWAQKLKYFDEIWTASAFCQNAIARCANVPVIKIPHPIEMRSISTRIELRHARQDLGVFTFLTILNVYSDVERKNVLFTIRAFLNAHENKKNIRLLVKISNLEYDPALGKVLNEISENHENVKIISGYVDVTEIDKIYEQADVYVSLHRAEGFGLTISDAMSRGIPVIATGYSGNMEFCLAQDTRLVAYDIRKIGHNRLRYKQNDVWAEPDMMDATAAFIELVEDYSRWLMKAAMARKRVTQAFSLDVVGQLMQERIELIYEKFKYQKETNENTIDRKVEMYERYGF